MKAIILAGGRATRLPRSAENIPKALVRVAGLPILQHQINLLKKHGLTDIRFGLGYRSEQIIKYLKGKHEYVVEQEPLGTGGAIKFASQDLKEDFLVLNGDILCDIDFSSFVKHHQLVSDETRIHGTLAAWRCRDAREYGLIEHQENMIVNFLEKPKEVKAGHINVGFYILSPKVFSPMRRKRFSVEYDIFPKLVQNNSLAVFIHKGWWTDSGTEQRLAEINKKLQKK